MNIALLINNHIPLKPPSVSESINFSNESTINNLIITFKECNFTGFDPGNFQRYIGTFSNEIKIDGCFFFNSHIEGWFYNQNITISNSEFIASIINLQLLGSVTLTDNTFQNTIIEILGSPQVNVMNNNADGCSVDICAENVLLENYTMSFTSVIDGFSNFCINSSSTIALNNVTFNDQKETWRYLKVIHLNRTLQNSMMISYVTREKYSSINFESMDSIKDIGQALDRLACSQNYQIDNGMEPWNQFFYIYCTPLSSKYYSLAESTLEYGLKNNIIHKCTFEARCGDGNIFNKEIFWGHDQGGSNGLAFERCPSLYCCPMGEEGTQSYRSCNANRRGPLCGDCENRFIFPLVGLGCVAEENCIANPTRITYLLLPVMLLLFHRYDGAV